MQYSEELKSTAKAMVAKGKGILAADESTPTITKRFEQIKVESSERSRQEYRNMLFSASGIESCISGVILYDETIWQKTLDGKLFPEFLSQKGILPGIKVDTGAKDLALHPGEKITEGLDGLGGRLKEYRSLGAKFTKWRAVIKIGDGIPSQACIEGNAHALARYAALCQENGLVPIVEPEVLMDGDHSIDTCYRVTSRVQTEVFKCLISAGVMLEGIVLKPSMVISGTEYSDKADVDSVAAHTVKCLLANVPPEVPGIAFLSGGQSDEIATDHLNAMNVNHSDLPWNLTFSYGRALQHPALTAWSGDDDNILKAQEILYHRAHCNGLATTGEYENTLETEPA